MLAGAIIGRWWGVVLITVGAYLWVGYEAGKKAPDVNGIIAAYVAAIIGLGALVGYVIRRLLSWRARPPM